MTESSAPSAGTERHKYEPKDIVERLRERTENIDAIFEAADEIESLRAELSRRSSPAAGKESGLLQAGDPTSGAEQGGAWQPIETAPKTDADVLVLRPDGSVRVAWWHRRGGHWATTPGAWVTEAIAWMPAPKAEGLSAGGEQPKAASPEAVREAAAAILEARALGYRARADHLFNGRIIADELDYNAKAIRALSPPQGGEAAKG